MINQQLDSASQKDILNEVNNMFDNMGIVQHHMPSLELPGKLLLMTTPGGLAKPWKATTRNSLRSLETRSSTFQELSLMKNGPNAKELTLPTEIVPFLNM